VRASPVINDPRAVINNTGDIMLIINAATLSANKPNAQNKPSAPAADRTAILIVTFPSHRINLIYLSPLKLCIHRCHGLSLTLVGMLIQVFLWLFSLKV
jgi:hypothetical protein